MKILNLNIENSTYQDIISKIKESIEHRKKLSFTYVNAYVALSALKDDSLAKALNNITALYSDGVGVFWASKFLYGKSGLQQRINGTDLYFKILDLAEQQGYKVFFFGGGEKAVDNLESTLKKKYPRLIIGGIEKRDISFCELILEKINQSSSDILFLGLGTPYQEKWISYFGKKCNIPIQISVGSGIDFISGAYKRAPLLFQKFGLEWLYRLLLEPKRLWKRYILGIPYFFYLVVKQKISKS